MRVSQFTYSHSEMQNWILGLEMQTSACWTQVTGESVAIDKYTNEESTKKNAWNSVKTLDNILVCKWFRVSEKHQG